jgi:glycosyltransferase involved in cell wall biosynthesis
VKEVISSGLSDSNTTMAPRATSLQLHVLVVSNHWDHRKKAPAAGVFVDRQVASLRKAGVKISTFDISTSHSPLNLFIRWMKLYAQVQRLKPDIVHARYGTIVAALTVLSARPAVITFCGSDLNPGASVSRLRMRIGLMLSNLAALRARAIVCVSEELRQRLWWHHDRAVVIPDGIDLDLFSPGGQDEARKKLGWDLNRPITIFHVGSDPKLKGLGLAKSAMKVAQARIHEAELRLISNVEPNLMPLYYRAADALLCTSMNEGSPNVVKEALACNLPVVSVPVGDVAERLAGIYPSQVVPRDPKVIGECLARILLSRKRSNGREHILHLGLDQVAQRVLNVYRMALG